MLKTVSTHLTVVILFVSCCAQWSSAQCITSTIKHCFLEQFSNACESEPCQALNQSCGAWVDGNEGSYAGVKSAPTGSDSIVLIPQPILCGTVKSCACGTIQGLLGLYCKQTSNVLYNSYWVRETMPGADPCGGAEVY